jgi:hypothetical protein
MVQPLLFGAILGKVHSNRDPMGALFSKIVRSNLPENRVELLVSHGSGPVKHYDQIPWGEIPAKLKPTTAAMVIRGSGSSPSQLDLKQVAEERIVIVSSPVRGYRLYRSWLSSEQGAILTSDDMLLVFLKSTRSGFELREPYEIERNRNQLLYGAFVRSTT